MADKTRELTKGTTRQVLVNAHFQCIRNIYQAGTLIIARALATNSKSVIEIVEKEEVAEAIRMIVGTTSLCSAMPT